MVIVLGFALKSGAEKNKGFSIGIPPCRTSHVLDDQELSFCTKMANLALAFAMSTAPCQKSRCLRVKSVASRDLITSAWLFLVWR